MRTGTHRAIAAWLGCLAAAACADDASGPRPATRAYPVVHAVLNPSASSQVVLVEEALTGRVATQRPPVTDPLDPILTGGGTPVSFAQVLVTGPLRQMALRERANFFPGESLPTFAGDGRGRGYYFFVNSPPPPSLPTPPDIFMSLMPGATYALEIAWPDGSHVVRGETTIPLFRQLAMEPARRFDRDQDTLTIQLPGPASSILASRYLVRVTTPHGPTTFFTDSAQVRLSGGLVNIHASGAPDAFVPGFAQRVDVAAVDFNYYDYYRTADDPRAGTVRRSHLQGAGGLFGAYVHLGAQLLDVVAAQEDPREGAFRREATGDTLDLYLTRGAVLSGQLRGAAAGRRGNLLGRLADGRVELALVSFQGTGDTLATFSGIHQGDAIVGRFSDEAQPSTFQRVAVGAP